MAVDPVGTLYTGVFLAVVAGLYGWLIAILWSPFLLAGRLRNLFETLPPSDWRVNYALWMPLPAAIWGFFFGFGLSLSLDVRPPAKASPIYLAGLDGIGLATIISLPLWPALLLYVIPDRGLDWNPNDYGPKTTLLVATSTLWYLVFLVGPGYVLSILAGLGDVMSHG